MVIQTIPNINNTLREERGSGGTWAMMFENLIRVASGYGARSNVKEIITINVNKTKNYPVAKN